MARHTRLTNLAVNTEATALAQLLDGGYIELYDGEQPDFAETPISERTPIVTMRLSDPACRPPVAGVLISNPIQPGVAMRTGRPTWARISRADKRTVMDISAGIKDAILILPVPIIEKGITLSIESFTHTLVKA